MTSRWNPSLHPRDAFGRWTVGAGNAIKANRPKYVTGSLHKNSHVGQGGQYKGVKIGAEFRTPGGRGVLLKGIAGYHGKPQRRLDVTPAYDRTTRTATVTAKPNPGRVKPTAGKMHTQSAGSKVSTGTTGRNRRATPARSASAGRKVRR